MPGVRLEQRCLLAARAQPLDGVGPLGLEHPESLRSGRRPAPDERPLDQLGEVAGNPFVPRPAVAGHGHRRIEREASGEDGKAAKGRSLRLAEQIVAPADHRMQRLVLRQRAPTRPCQQLEAIGETRLDRGEPEGRHPHRRQLDRQGVGVELPAELGGRGERRTVEHQGRIALADPSDEELHRRRRGEQGGIRFLGRRQAEHRHVEPPLAGDAQRPLAGGEDAHRRTRLQQVAGQRRGGIDQVLAVVHHDPGVGVAKGMAQPRERRRARRVGQAERLGERRGDVFALGHGRELDDMDLAPLAAAASRRRATSKARRVLPTPPGPSTVRHRQDAISSPIAATSRSRPISGVNGMARASGRPRFPPFVFREGHLVDGAGEPVASPRDRVDQRRPVAERLAQRTDVLVQGVLDHHHVGPDGSEQVFLGHQAAARPQQAMEDLERGAADRHRAAVAQQLPTRQQLEGVESPGDSRRRRGRRTPLRGVPVHGRMLRRRSGCARLRHGRSARPAAERASVFLQSFVSADPPSTPTLAAT